MPSVHRRDAVVRGSIISILILLLSACGGGSSGSDQTGSTIPIPPAPALTQPIYSGNTNQAVLDSSNAPRFTAELYQALNLLEYNSGVGVFLTSQTYNETDHGAGGGTLRLLGAVDSSHGGWLEQMFTNYSSSNTAAMVINGTETIYAEGGSENFTMGYNHLKLGMNGTTFEFNGEVGYQYEGGILQSAVANVSISTGSEQTLLSNFQLTVTNSTEAHSIAGKMYDSSAGYVLLSAPIAPAYSVAGGQYPFVFLTEIPANLGYVKADIQMTGAGRSILHVQPMNEYFDYLGLDIDGDGKIDQGARFDVITDELDAVQPPGSTVSALAVLPGADATGKPVVVDGRFSYTPGGFVSYSWGLVAAPFGSKVTVSGSEPTVQFSPDVAGDYLVQLTVTANGKSATDVVPVSYTGQTAGPEMPVTSLKVQNFIYAHVGESVTLDGRASPLFYFNPDLIFDDVTWTLSSPHGSSAVVTDPTSTVTSFVPDKAGIYYVILGAHLDATSIDPGQVGVISVDQPVRFAPPAMVLQSGGLAGLNAGMFGGTGDGVAIMTFPFLSTSGNIESWSSADNGLFSARDSIAFTSNELPDLLTVDLNGDGISDFVTGTNQNVSNCPLYFHKSGSSGYTLSSVDLDSNCAHWETLGSLRRATIGGHPAVVVVDNTYGSSGAPSFAAFLADSSGNMQAPVITAVNGGVFHSQVLDFALADVDGDGEPDLVATFVSSSVSATHYVQVYHGNGDGSFTYLASYLLSGTPGTDPVAVGDFNGDGNMDIAVATNNMLNFFYGDGTGSFPTSPETRSITCGGYAMQAVDINGDGHPDLILGEDQRCGAYDNLVGQEMFLSTNSTSSGGSISLDQGEIYPLVVKNPDLMPLGVFWGDNTGAHGDFNGDGLQDLMLDWPNGLASDLLYIPQLPAITSATIVSNSPASAAVPKEQPNGARLQQARSMARVHVAPPG